MRQMHINVAALTAGAVLMLAAQAHAAVIHVGSASGAAGSTVDLSVSLTTDAEAEMVAGTQNDISFQAGARVAARANGRPDCAVNVAIDKGATTFAFQPSMCTGDACTGVRALVLSFDNTDAIPTGSVLYTCKVAIAASASGSLPLTCSNSGASDPDGNALTTTCTNGTVTVPGGPTPTPTGIVEAEAIIHVGSTMGDPGEPGLSIDVTLEVPLLGTEVAGTQNDITFAAPDGDLDVRIRARANGRPDCAVNPAIDKGATTFAFQPSACTGDACRGVRALVLSFDNTDAIPDGSVLYTCQIEIASAAEPGETYPLTCSNAGASDPDGDALTTSCTNGEVIVGGIEATHTPTNTVVGGTPTPTRTAAATATNTREVRPTFPFFTNDDDACAIVSPANSHAGWMLLLPAGVLLWLRRRSR